MQSVKKKKKKAHDKNGPQIELDFHVLITVQEKSFSKNSDLLKEVKLFLSVKKARFNLRKILYICKMIWRNTAVDSNNAKW